MTKFLQGVRGYVPIMSLRVWSQWLIQQIQYGHLEFLENVNNSELDTDLCTDVGGKMHVM